MALSVRPKLRCSDLPGMALINLSSERCSSRPRDVGDFWLAYTTAQTVDDITRNQNQDFGELGRHAAVVHTASSAC